ncbi:hypothetical protein K505DRAFT_347320 [Melanomma pulvis-pyrius CBS 109.77]|uniref:Uncharacterized protein n=1 Tax=Melanomma pulvis-pyrius CBS 109.77 TaxID=1314802 RepID=A0A6A6XLD9_9PLEO|nr:hypothetical protein K505DRAFT_347320 [Melanomma pulvis-pyrius CBS 109.77]
MAPEEPHTCAANASTSPGRQARAATAYADRRKRVRLTPTPTESSTSDPSFSDESALVPTSVPAESTDASDVVSDSSEMEESSEDPSSDSESGEDSDEELQSEMEDEDGIVNLPAVRARKPNMKLPKDELGPDLRPFLANFLPQLKAANEALEKEREAGTLKTKVIDSEDAVDGEGEYIEMDLGLGVLEEQDPDAKDVSSSSDSEDEDSLDGEGQLKPKDILSKLMGRKSRKDAVDIQELGDVQAT